MASLSSKPGVSSHTGFFVLGRVRVAGTASVVPSWERHLGPVGGGQAEGAAASTHHHAAWKHHRNKQELQVGNLPVIQHGERSRLVKRSARSGCKRLLSAAIDSGSQNELNRIEQSRSRKT